MKKLYLINVLLFSLILTACRTTQNQSSEHSTQAKYLPDQFSKLYLGMTLKDFCKVKDVNKMTISTISSFRTEYEEQINDKTYKSVVYYLDNDNNHPLYELIIEYQSSFDLANYISTKYGNPNSGSNWIFDSGEGFKIKIWTFDYKLVITGVIKGTEWDE